jgi:hypothetical protein
VFEFEFHLGPLHLVLRLGEQPAEVEEDPERRDVDMPAAQVERAPETWDVEDRRRIGFRPNGG